MGILSAFFSGPECQIFVNAFNNYIFSNCIKDLSDSKSFRTLVNGIGSMDIYIVEVIMTWDENITY